MIPKKSGKTNNMHILQFKLGKQISWRKKGENMLKETTVQFHVITLFDKRNMVKTWMHKIENEDFTQMCLKRPKWVDSRTTDAADKFHY